MAVTFTVRVPPQASTLTDFPLYVDLSTAPAGFWSSVSNGGGDIRCYAEDGTTELPREVVSCDTATDTGELHVKVTLSSSAATYVKIDTDGTRTEPAASSTYGSEAVWSDYAAVYHGNDLTNSTGGTDLTADTGSPTSGNASGAISDFFDMANGTFKAAGTSYASGGVSRTLSGWFRTAATGDQTIASIGGNSGDRWAVRTDASGGQWKLRVETPQDALLSSSAVNTGSWIHFGVAQDGNNLSGVSITLNGADDSGTAVSGVVNTEASAFVVGGYDGGSRAWLDDLDEIRLKESADSLDWIAAEYENQSDPASFYSIMENHKATVTVDSTTPSAAHTDFPQYIDLAGMTPAFWSTVANGGGDIRCFLPDGTELAREVVSCDTTAETGELHVKFPLFSLVNDNVIEIHADGSSSEPASTATYGRDAVWGDYEAVSHDGGLTDSSGNLTFTQSGSPTAVAGPFTNATEYNGSNQYSEASIVEALQGQDRSFSAWFNPDTIGQQDALLGIYDDVTSNNWQAIWFDEGSLTANAPFMWDRGTAGADVRLATSTGATTGSWQYVSAGGGDSAVYISLDGGTPSTATADTLDSRNADNFTIGRAGDSSPSQFFDGKVAEVRWRNDHLSTNWIADEYTNQNTPATFYTVSAVGGGGTEVTVPLGSATVTGFAPTVSISANIEIEVGVESLAITGYSPTVSTSDATEVEVGLGTATVTGFAPTVFASESVEVEIGADALTVTGYAPVVAVGDAQVIPVPAAALSVSGFAPTVSITSNISVEIPAGTVEITTYTPTVGVDFSVTVPVGSTEIVGYEPTATASTKTVLCTLVDTNGNALPNLTNLSYAWFDEPDPANLTTAVIKGVTESTDGSGEIEVPVSDSTLSSGQVGLLILRSSDGVSLGAYNLAIQ